MEKNWYCRVLSCVLVSLSASDCFKIVGMIYTCVYMYVYNCAVMMSTFSIIGCP